MINSNYLIIFATVIQAGSISRAAKQLGCGKSVISRQLAKLEAELGVRLIQRSTRRLALTEIGELVLQEALQIRQALTHINQLTDQFQQEVCGVLRVTCTRAGRRLLVPLITQFALHYPQVTIDLQLDDQVVDLISKQIDVAIRVSYLSDSSLIARKLADNPSIIVAAPSYIRRAGQPLAPAKLSEHSCVLYSDCTYDTWTFIEAGKEYKVKIKGAVHINDTDALIMATIAGAGILKTARHLVVEELARGTLVPLLTEYVLPPGPPIYAVYPARNFLATKTSTFVHYIQEAMQKLIKTDL